MIAAAGIWEGMDGVGATFSGLSSALRTVVFCRQKPRKLMSGAVTAQIYWEEMDRPVEVVFGMISCYLEMHTEETTFNVYNNTYVPMDGLFFAALGNW